MTSTTENQIPIEIGTTVPMGGITGLNLAGTIVAIDEISAKVETPWFSKWYPHAQIRATLAAERDAR